MHVMECLQIFLFYMQQYLCSTVTQDLISTLKLVSLGPKQLWPQGSKNKEIY